MPTLEEIEKLPKEQKFNVLNSMSVGDLQILRDEAVKKQEKLKFEAPNPSTTGERVPNIEVQKQKDYEILNALPTDQLLKLRNSSPAQIEAFMVEARKPGIGKQLLNGAIAVGEFIDKYTGAPARAALGEIITPAGEKPSLTDAASTFVNQFGEDPNLAPTGKDIAKRLDFSEKKTLFELPVIGEVSPAGLVGLGIDVAVDPLNLIPVTALVGGVAKGAKAGTKLILKGSAKAADIIPGVKSAKKVVDTVAEGAKASLNMLFNPSIADDFDELSKIAKANGINVNMLPESVEFGERSLISRAARVQREGLQGEKLLNEFENSLDQVRGAFTKKVEQVAKGPIYNKIEAGTIIRDGYDKSVKRMFDGLEDTYSTIIKDYPGLKIEPQALGALNSKLNGIEKFAKGRIARGVTNTQKSQGQQLLIAVGAIRNSNGSFKQTVEALRNVGEAAFKPKNLLELDPPDIQRLQGLYGDLSDALKDTIRRDVSKGDKVVEALELSNKAMSDFFGEKSVISKFVGNQNLSPERVFDTLVMNGDSYKIDALKNILSKPEFDALKGTFVESLIKREADGTFSFAKLTSALRNKKQIMGQIFAPEEIKELADLARLGDRYGLTIMSTSGTGASNILKDIAKGFQESITNEAFIEGLKNRARKTGAIQKAAVEAPKQSITFGLPKRTKLDFGLKGAQLQSIQERNENTTFSVPSK